MSLSWRGNALGKWPTNTEREDDGRPVNPLLANWPWSLEKPGMLSRRQGQAGLQSVQFDVDAFRSGIRRRALAHGSFASKQKLRAIGLQPNRPLTCLAAERNSALL